jgi:hypothetical protein
MFYLVNTSKNLQILELGRGKAVYWIIDGKIPNGATNLFFLPYNILDSAETYSELFDKHVEKLI